MSQKIDIPIEFLLRSTYAYTDRSSLVSIPYSDDTPDVTFGYDRLGRQISAMVDGVATNLYSYDALTLALSLETQNGVAITRATDALGRPVGLALDSDYAVNYGYDEFGRFASVASSIASTQSIQSMYTYSYLPNTDLLSGYTAGNFTRTVAYEPARPLITSVANTFDSSTISQYDYENDALGRRTSISRSGTAFGDMPVRDSYGYNHRSEVTSARRTLTGNPSQEVRGFSYDYEYDPIGNRVSSTEYDPDNSALVSSYTANALNQYEQRTIPGYAAVRGSATNTATVTVNGNPAWRLDDSFYGGDEADNSNSAVMKELAIIAAHSNQYSAVTGSVFVAQTPEEFTYDDDGNLLSDGRWHYTWNGENRLIKAEELVAPTNREPYVVEYAYDHQGRMVWKSIAPTTGSPTKTTTYTWDDYNIVAEHVTTDSTITTYNVWGLDLSSSLQGAGGVGGLLAVIQGRDGSPSRPFLPCYDANGNITEYLSSDGTIAAHYEYSPFGEIVAQSGDLASTFTHRFSTKPWCAITGLSEYLLRKYSPVLGKWINRDPIGELANDISNYNFMNNNTFLGIDFLGLHRMLTGSLIFKRGKTLDLEGYVYARQIIRLTDELNQIQDAQGRRCYKVIIKDLVTSQLEDVKKDINQSPDDVFIVAHGGLDVNGKIWRYDSYQWNSKDTVIEGFDITYDGDLTPIAEFIPINPNDLFGCYISPHVRKVKNGLLSKKRSSIDTFDRLHRRRL